MGKAISNVNKILLYGFFITGVVLLFVSVRASTMIMAFGFFVSSIILAWLLKNRGISEKYLLYINIGLWLGLFGEMYAYYNPGITFYDKVLHFSVGILIAAIIFDCFSKQSHLKKDFVFFTSLGIFALWEIFEYSSDVFFGTQFQGVVANGVFSQSRIDDTMVDLIWGSIGAVSYLFFKKEKIGEAIKTSVKNIKKKEGVKFSKFLKDIFAA